MGREGGVQVIDFHTSSEEKAHDKAWLDYDNQFGSTTDREALAWGTAWRAARDYFQEKSTDTMAEPAPADDGYLRQLALHTANQPGLNSESVLAAAEKYLAFLKGQ